MTAALVFELSLAISFGMLSLALLITVARVVVGPTLPDRVLALDTLTVVAIGFIAVLGLGTGQTLYVDIAIALGLVGFLATVAFARFILRRKTVEEEIIMDETK
jgi:multicomponent Na+:H+ antiporter subunit F